MGSNTSKGRGNKGSKLWMQIIINSDMKMELERRIGIGEINWLSPLANDHYAEYKLNQDYIAELIGIPKTSYGFWPTNQPQWDAIGMTGDTIILVEAKAHLKELYSSLSATSKASIKLINESMGAVFQKNYSGGNFKKWIKGYYQLGNRLTFLDFMNDLASKNGRHVQLVLLNIVNDPTYISTTEKEWNDCYGDVFLEMTGRSAVPGDVTVVNFLV